MLRHLGKLPTQKVELRGHKLRRCSLGMIEWIGQLLFATSLGVIIFRSETASFLRPCAAIARCAAEFG